MGKHKKLWSEASGWLTVESVTDTGKEETVYNFRVADFHTYFVGCDEWGFSVWAHNSYEQFRDALGLNMTPELDAKLRRVYSHAVNSPDLLVDLLQHEGLFYHVMASDFQQFKAGHQVLLADYAARLTANPFTEHDTGLRWQEGRLHDPDGLQGVNEDWRGQSRTVDEAVARAFERTGIPREEFVVTRWAHQEIGLKTAPVEWKGPHGAEVSIDWPHFAMDRRGKWMTGPDAPHVGWQVGQTSADTQVGHILLDYVPYGRGDG